MVTDENGASALVTWDNAGPYGRDVLLRQAIGAYLDAVGEDGRYRLYETLVGWMAAHLKEAEAAKPAPVNWVPT